MSLVTESNGKVDPSLRLALDVLRGLQSPGRTRRAEHTGADPDDVTVFTPTNDASAQMVRRTLRRSIEELTAQSFDTRHGFPGLPVSDEAAEDITRFIESDPQMRDLLFQLYAARAEEAERLIAAAASHQEQEERCPLRRSSIDEGCEIIGDGCDMVLCLYHALPTGELLHGEERMLHLQAATNVSISLAAAGITPAEYAALDPQQAASVNLDLSQSRNRRAFQALVDESYNILGHDIAFTIGYDICADPMYVKFVLGPFVKKIEASISFPIPYLNVK